MQRPRDLVVVALALLALGGSLLLLSRVQPNETATVELILPPALLAPLERVRGSFREKSAEIALVVLTSDVVIADARLDAIEASLRALPGVTRTWSARSRPHLVMERGDARLAPGPPRGAGEALDRFLRPDPRTALVWIALDAHASTLTGARAFVDALDAFVASARRPGERLRATGTPSQRVASWTEARRDGARALPWLLAAVVLVPFFFFRSLVAVVLPLVIAGLTSATLLALHRLVVGRLDVWVLALFPLVWSIATMDALHLYEGASEKDGVDHARARLALPALVTCGTTALSMLTLAVPGAPPLLRSFGLWGAFGAFIAYGYTFLLGASLLRLFPPRPVPAWPGRLARRIVCVARRHARLVALGWLVVLGGAGVGLTRLVVEPSYQHVFRAGVPAGDTLRALEAQLDCELVPFEIYLEAVDERQRRPEQLMGAALGLHRYLSTLPETRLPLSAALLVDEWLRTDPGARAAIDDPTFFAGLRERVRALAADSTAGEWIDLERGVVRTQLFLRRSDYPRKEELARWIDHFVATNTIGYRVVLGGPSWLYHLAEREGLRGVAWGVVADLVLLVILLGLLLRRARLVGVALAGNVAPVIALCGLMGLAGLPWSFDLLGLPVIVLGLAIDDTVHLLWPLVRAPDQPASRFAGAVRRAGTAVLATAVLLAASLACLSRSAFGVNRTLGLLLPVGLVMALLAELTLVPALLTSWRRRSSPSSPSRSPTPPPSS